MVLRAAAGLRGERRIDFAFADLDPALGEALAHALDDDLVADRTAEIGERQAFAGQLLRAAASTLTPFCWATPATALFNFLVADPDAGFGGARDLQLHQDESFQHLPLQHVLRRQLARLVGVLRGHVRHRAIQFALQDHVFVDHRGDAVERLQVLRGRVCADAHREGGDQAGEEKSGSHSLHGSGSGPESLSSGSGVVLLGGTR